LNKRAKALFLTGQTLKAMNDVNRGLKLAPSNADFYKLRADILSSNGDFQNTVRDYGKAIGFAPYASVVYNNRAVALANINKPKEAVEDLNSAMELATTRPNSSTAPVFHGLQW